MTLFYPTTRLTVPSIITKKVSGGGGGYAAKAVHFDGSTFFTNNSVSCTDSYYLLLSLWCKFTVNNTNAFLCSDPDGAANNLFSIDQDNANYTLDFELGDNPFVNTYSPNTTIVTPSGWQNVIFAADTNHSASQKLGEIDLNDVSLSFTPHDSNAAFKGAFNGLKTTLFTDESNFCNGDIADFQMYLLNSSPFVAGALPTATRRLFIDGSGKPVDPAIAVAALGTPLFLFSGDHTTFPTNQGSGGAFTLTGTLTDASTHP